MRNKIKDLLVRFLIFLVGRPQPEKVYAVKWQKEPEINEIYRLLITNEFLKFMQHCQKIACDEVALIRDDKARVEACIKMNAIYWVQAQAEKIVIDFEKSLKPIKNEEGNPYSLDDTSLLEEISNNG